MNFQKEQFSLTRSAEYSTLHPTPKAPEVLYEIGGINDIRHKKYRRLLHLHLWDSNKIMGKRNRFVSNFDFYSHTLLIKTWSEQQSRFELKAAHLKLAESVDTVGNTD